MNEVSQQLAQTPLAPEPIKGALDEMQAFVMLDPLLADLHKQYLDAKANYQSALKEFGKHDGMTEIAAQMEDSAWCAMQTRYMEVRADRAMMAQAQSMMAESIQEEKESVRNQKEQDALQAWANLQFYQSLQKKTKADADDALVFFYLMANMREMTYRPYHATHNFNHMAA
ncbi:MAG: hypothetical protein DI551_12430 [Micavibrio aeruginosavorus]|uniref:Uncharacterized protein n=1 Tax=Micavibrio aeruginosavorus TaxID=349221 RepID=A0A2W5MR94_9BACT|nr:MAG: hypothetical protein DI551_12430 [Micavibrio aeruginosavorus]